MKKNLKTNVKLALSSIFLAGLVASCSKWDDFKKYTDKGEIMYAGKLDSIKVFSGDERVKISALLPADPKVVKAKVFWNDGADSTEITIDRSTDRNLFEKIIPMSEGIKSFVVYTYDAQGNKSVATHVVGIAYGQRYKNTLANRAVGNAAMSNGTTTINWLTIDPSAGPLYTEVRYMSNDGEKVIEVPTTTDLTTITDLKSTEKTFSYRTLYKPNKTSIDTFATDYKTAGIFRDATAEYLANTKVPMATVANSGRWGIPADWITNAAVKNYKHTDGNFYGGVDYWFGGPFLAMEAGWSWDNMKSYTNGKIYQSPTLPAGTYTIECDVPDCSANGRFYLVATVGDEISNIENLESTLAYVRTNTKGTHSMTFKLTETKKVSIGFVGSLTNSSDFGQFGGEFFRVTAVRLKQLAQVN